MKSQNMKGKLYLALVLAVLASLLICAPALAAKGTPKLAMNKKTATLYVGSDGAVTIGQLETNAQFVTKSRTAQFAWTSSNPKVVTVNKDGKIKPIGTGKAYVIYTLTDGAKKQRALCKVTVKPVVPKTVSFSADKVVISQGESKQLKTTISPANAYNKNISYRSSNTKVAKVSKTGVVTGIKPGAATIYCKTASGKRIAKIKVSVSHNFSGVTYRVYAIGNANYMGDGKLPGCKTDVKMVAAAFRKARFSGKAAKVNAYTDLKGSQMRSLLGSMSKSGADSNDVTVFYYSGHGMSSSSVRGALCGVDWDLVTVKQVQQALDKVPGKVIVMLDCCLSGQYITSKGAVSSTTSSSSFNKTVIEEFKSDFQSKALTDSKYKNKYKIITASGPREPSYISNDRRDDCSVFTDYLALALGVDCYDGVINKMYGDKNGDSVVTLKELYGYVNARVNAYVKRNKKYKQTTMVWPANDSTPIIARS